MLVYFTQGNYIGEVIFPQKVLTIIIFPGYLIIFNLTSLNSISQLIGIQLNKYGKNLVR